MSCSTEKHQSTSPIIAENKHLDNLCTNNLLIKRIKMPNSKFTCVSRIKMSIADYEENL